MSILNMFNKKPKWCITARTGEGIYDYEECREFDAEEKMLKELAVINQKIKEGYIEEVDKGKIINWGRFVSLFYGKR